MQVNYKNEIAVFGGGCFWCTEAVFKMLRGVIAVEPGYTGGSKISPTYEEVSTGETGHVEVIRIEFDSTIIKYRDLMTVFFGSHDPTTLNRQGNDVGTQYRSVIFYANAEQQKQATTLIAELNSSNTEGEKIVTQVEPLGIYNSAESYHKDYFENHKDAPYCQLVINPKLEKVQKEFDDLLDKWKKSLTAEQYAVLREKGTEPPFIGKYVNEHKDGIYHCAACDNALFESGAKFDSSTGWPSFDQALPGAVKEMSDDTMGMHRTEIICARCGSHLGHLFHDGPTKTGMRYCLNSICLDLDENK